MTKTSLPESLSSPLDSSILPSDKPQRRLSDGGTFAALKHYNYRLWFAGQLVSLIGTWMQTTAQGYLIYQITGSPVFLGLVSFVPGIPAWLFILYGGVVADRMPRRNLMVVTQSAMMVLALILAGLTYMGWIRAWHILVLAFLLGIANAFDAPARQAFVLEMVPREHMTNAIALNSTMFNMATAIGPATGGLLYAVLGPTWCFTINGISFLAVIVALLLMRINFTPPPPRPDSTWADIAAGVGYVRTSIITRTVIILLSLVSLFGVSFLALIPAWAVKILGGDAATNGFLQSARGIGSIAGALMVAVVGTRFQRGKLVMLGNFIMPFCLIIFAAVRWLPLSLLFMAGIGWSYLVSANSANALVQSEVPDELRGRVMSIYTLSFFGLMPIGSLLAGGAAAGIGEPFTVVLGAVIMLVCTMLVWKFVPELRRAG
jgi:MFS family permease